jgi:hypothetical protein
MAIYRSEPGMAAGSEAIGILMLDCRLPFIPGDVGNASTYRYPVLFKTVPGLSTAVCLNGAPEFAAAAIAGAKALEAEGVRGISSDCGFMLQFQDAVREAVSVPVCLSSLLQLPLVAASLEASRPIGIVTADSANLTGDFLARAGVAVDKPIVIRGMQGEPEFKTAVFDEKGTLDSDAITEEAVAVVRRMAEEHPRMGAVILECSMLPPYAKAVQDAVGLPVYDFVTVIDYLRAAAHPPPRDGRR